MKLAASLVPLGFTMFMSLTAAPVGAEEAWKPLMENRYLEVDTRSVATWEQPNSNPVVAYIGAVFKVGKTADHSHYGYRIDVEQCLRKDGGELDAMKIEGRVPKNVAEEIRTPEFRMVGTPPPGVGSPFPHAPVGVEGWIWKRGGARAIDLAGGFLCDTAKEMKLGEKFGFKGL